MICNLLFFGFCCAYNTTICCCATCAVCYKCIESYKNKEQEKYFVDDSVRPIIREMTEYQDPDEFLEKYPEDPKVKILT